VIRGCNQEILALHKLHTDREIHLKDEALEFSEHFAKSDKWANLGFCISEIDKTFNGPIPNLSETLKRINPDLASGIKRYHSEIDITRYFQPSPRDLVPFVVLLTVATAFNPDTILTQTWHNTSEIDRLGKRAFRFIGMKPRSNQDQMQILEDTSHTNEKDRDLVSETDLSIGWTLDFLKQLTSRIRNFVEPEDHRDRLFVFVNKTRDKTPKSFGSNLNTSPSIDSTWIQNLRKFCEANGLPRFTLKQIRKTIIDMNTF
jgi:hypothetical protein